VNNRVFSIWCNHDFAGPNAPERDLLIEGVGRHQLQLFDLKDDGKHGAARAALENADIAFGYPQAAAVDACGQLRWVHLHFAGYTAFDHADLKQRLIARGTALTNSSAVYDEPCAQHLLAMIMTLARGLPAALDDQRNAKSWPMLAQRSRLPLLGGQTVLILSYGAIARRLVELLTPLRMNLIGVRRDLTGDEVIPVIPVSDVDEWLPRADHVVDILPANDGTANFLNAQRLASLKRGVIVYNIGRGTTLDQQALAQELRGGRIAAAYLDVTDPEPLPADHFLWETPNCFITPHTGGGHVTEKQRQVKHFLDNLRRFEKGEPLHNRIL
jgi:phosphoglycerate dehydrogenase-like enzyme